MDSKTKHRTRVLLVSILSELRSAFDHLHKKKPKLFRQEIESLVLDEGSWREARHNIDLAIQLIRNEKGREINWNALEMVGLSSRSLEWKADLHFETLGRPKPEADQLPLPLPQDSGVVLTYETGKPVWRRLFQLAKSFLESLIKAVKETSKLRYILDFIKEYIDCVDAAVSYRRSADEAV
jgi:hypothetical protein